MPTVLLNSLVVAGGATIVAVGLGLVSAFAIAGLPPVVRRVAVLLAVVAVAMPSFLVVNCWLHYFGNTGVWRQWLPVNLFSFAGATWLMATLYWPISLLAAIAGWGQLSQAHLESEPTLRGWQLLRWLLWPAARNSLFAAASLTFALALNQFTIPAILQVKVLPVEVWIRFSTNLEPLQALGVSWPLVLLPLIVLFCLRRVDIRWNVESGATQAQAFRRQIGSPWFTLSAVITACLLAISIGLPVVQLLTTPATWGQFRAAADATWPLTLNSFWFAAGAASTVVAVSTVSRHWTVGLTLWLLFLIPGMLLSISLIWLLNRPGLDVIYRSAAVIFLVLVLRYAGPAWGLICHAFGTADPSLIESTKLDGLRGWRFFRHVHCPRLAPAAGAAWYISYLLCLWDVETLTLLYPPGTETLALRIFNLLHYGHNAQVNALCLLLLALAALPACAYSLWAATRSFGRSL